MTYGIQHPKSRSKAIRAYPCGPCGKETPFQNEQCLYCSSPRVDAGITALQEKKDARKALSYKERAIAGAIRGFQMSSARREYWKRKAEENREKWEGKT